MNIAAPVPWAAAETLGALTPELAAFQDEPLQMKSGTVGKTGFLHLGFERRDRHTVLARLERRAPYMVQRALYCDHEMPELAWVFLITTSGCLLQGSPARSRREAWCQCAGARYHAVGYQDHSMDANYAAQTQTIALSDDAYLEFLPDPLIPHRNARFVSDTNLDCADGHTSSFGNHPTWP